jgi:DNA-binding NarL/FixJ family response regulator
VANPVNLAADEIQIVLADDHAMIRSGLRRVLDSEVGLNVVAEAGDVQAALDLTREHQPRVVLLDLNMPGAPTLPAIPDFLEAAPGTAVVVLTMDPEPTFASRALSAGARGYILKEAAETELVEAVRSVVAGPRRAACHRRSTSRAPRSGAVPRRSAARCGLGVCRAPDRGGGRPRCGRIGFPGDRSRPRPTGGAEGNSA